MTAKLGLEAKLPPPVLVAMVAAAMWAAALALGPNPGNAGWRVAGTAVAGTGIGILMLAARQFRRARTTINPVRPEAASAVVTEGVFRLTRNPMYVGMALLLSGWGMFLGSPWMLLGPVGFVAFLTRFQIVPEERAMSAKFSEAYEAYRRRVRRWI